MLIGQLKTCDAQPHLRVAAVGRLRLERTDCQKYMYMQGVVCDVKQRVVFITFHFLYYDNFSAPCM